ncbi:MAG: adenylate/guanylate cyclase domain-containing protein [Verrucomicrobiota bacterium]
MGKAYRILNSFFAPIALTRTAKKILQEEELQGEKITNRVRYFFGLLALGPTLAIVLQAGVPAGIAVNLSAFAIYFGITIAHSIVLKGDFARSREAFRYLVVVMDVFVVTVIIVFWTLYKAADAPAFALKNPSLYFFALVIVAPILQYRMRLITAALTLVLLVYGSFILWTWIIGFQETNHWRDYVLGESLVVSDVLLGRPVVFIGVALVAAFSIRQSLHMIARIGEAEAQRSVLARYFSPSVVDEITRRPEEVQHARRQKVTVLFLDIRGFTALCETIDEELLVAWLTEFRTEMTLSVFEFGGTLDKFIGDAVMATFGTPYPDEQPGGDSIRAVRTASSMFRRLGDLNERWSDRCAAPVKIGVGLHTGEVVAGNIGNELQMEYSVIGDPVNTASRIEGLCKKLGKNLLVSGEVYEEVKHLFVGTEMPPCEVKGKSEPLKIFAIDVEAQPEATG